MSEAVVPAALADALRLKRRFLRSVSLERDAQNGAGLDGYLPTPTALSVRDRIASALDNPSLRAVSITGPYGTGKSVFALYLAACLAPPSRAEWSDGLLPVFITGGREAIVPALLRALDGAVSGQTTGDIVLSAREVADRFALAAREVKRKKRARGLLVIVDELGKFLEWATLHPQQGDLQVLQEVAEMATRSGDAPVVFVTILHQAFDEYAHRLSALQRAEWQKVQGRFVDIPFGDSSEAVVRLIGSAFEGDIPPFASERALAQAQRGAALGVLPRGLENAGEAAGVFQSAFGLHPLALLALPPLFRRFAQSERTLFSFFGGDDPHGFGAFAARHGVEAQYGLDALFDYVSGALGTTLYSAPGYGKVWSQIEEAVARCEGRGDALEARVVKTVGLLHLLGESARLPASPDVLRFALTDSTTTAADVEAALRRLTQATILIFRKFKNAYRPYEGSDIDVEERLTEARGALGGSADLAAVARKRLPLAPLIARRHSFQTGTLRFFAVTLCSPADLAERVATDPEVADGSLLLCLTADDGEQAHALRLAADLTRSARPHVVVAVCLVDEALREAALTVEALEWVRENTPGIADDPVAHREITERRGEAVGDLEAQWGRLLLPGAGTVFVWQGARQDLPASGYALQVLLSDALAHAYPQSPILRNELLNRRMVSSTAAASRRNLIEAMITHRRAPLLGMEGYPAERMMYETLLAAPGLHREGEGGEWGFAPAPHPDDPTRLAPVWGEIEAYLLAGDLVQKPVTGLYDRLRARPFGVAEGLLPVLLVAALLCWEEDILVYESGAVLTQFDSATAERLLKRPQDFTAHGLRLAGERQAVLERFGRGLLRGEQSHTLVNIVRAIYAQVNKLPVYTRSTQRLPPLARKLRDAFKEARNPDIFLFVDLPRLFGVKPFTATPTPSMWTPFLFSGTLLFPV